MRLSNFFLLFAAISASYAAVPLQINHQGVVKVNGVPFDGVGQFRFAIVDPDTGLNGWTNDGSALFVQGMPGSSLPIPVNDGLYHVRLGDLAQGSVIPIPGEIFDDDNLVLRVWFDDGQNGVRQLTPDHPLTASPFSFKALRAEVAGDAEMATQALQSVSAEFANDADTLDGLDSTDLLSQSMENVRMLNEEFVVAPDETIEEGNVVSFVDGSAQIRRGFAPAGAGPKITLPSGGNRVFRTAIAAFDENRIIAAFNDADDGRRGYVVYGEISGDSIAFGSPESFTSGPADDLSIDVLSQDRFVLAYTRPMEANVVLGEVTGESIDFGTGARYFVGTAVQPGVVGLSEDRIVLFFINADNSHMGIARVGEVTGTEFDLQPEVPFHSDTTFELATAKLSPTQVLFAYYDPDDGIGPAGNLVVGDIESGGLVVGPEHLFNLGQPSFTSCVGLSENRFVVVYAESFPGIGAPSSARIGEVSGVTVILAQEYTYRVESSGDIRRVGALSPSRFVIANRRGSFPPIGSAGDWVLAEVTGTRIDYRAEGFFIPTPVGGGSLSLVSLSPELFAVVYSDQVEAALGRVNLVRPKPAPIIGIARENGSEGETVEVTLLTQGALSDSHSGLEPGATYFGHPDGGVSTDASGVRLGLAPSQTKILLLAP